MSPQNNKGFGLSFSKGFVSLRFRNFILFSINLLALIKILVAKTKNKVDDGVVTPFLPVLEAFEGEIDLTKDEVEALSQQVGEAPPEPVSAPNQEEIDFSKPMVTQKADE